MTFLDVPAPAHLALSDEQIDERIDEILRYVVDYSRRIETLIVRLEKGRARGDISPAEAAECRTEHERLAGRRDTMYHQARVLTGELERRRRDRRARSAAERADATAVKEPMQIDDPKALERVLKLLSRLKDQRVRSLAAERAIASKRAAEAQTMCAQSKHDRRKGVWRTYLQAEAAFANEEARRKFLAESARAVPSEARAEFNAQQIAAGYQPARSVEECADASAKTK